MTALDGSVRFYGDEHPADQRGAPSFTFTGTPYGTPARSAPAYRDPLASLASQRGPDPHTTPSMNMTTQSFIDHFSTVLNAPLPPSLRASSSAAPAFGIPPASMTPRRSTPTSTRGGPHGAVPPPSTVHDALYEEGRVIRQYKEALREAAVREEMATLRSPAVSAFAKELEVKRTRRMGHKQDVVERMEERVARAKAEEALRRQKIIDQRAAAEAAQRQLEEDEESFADSIDHEDDHVSRLKTARREQGAGGGDDTAAVSVAAARHHAARDDGRPRREFQPKLTDKGRRAVSKVSAPDFLMGWKHRQEQRLDTRRTQAVLQELAEVRDAPDISQRSRQLAARAKERDGLAGMPHLQAMQERDRQRRAEQIERRREEEARENLFNPKITVYAATLGEGDDPAHARARTRVTDRLYADAFDAEERRLQRLRQVEEEARQTAAATSQVRRNQQSVISRGYYDTSYRRTAADVADDLMERHERLRQSQRERAEAMEASERDLRRPAINPVSDAIVARLGHTANDRLLSGYRSLFERPLPEGPPEDPPIGRRSASTDAWDERDAAEGQAGRQLTRDEEARMASRLHGHADRRREHLRRLREQHEDEALAECSFQPEVHRAPRPVGPHAASTDAGVPVEERTQQWQQRRDARLQEQRAAVVEAEAHTCTFTPAIGDPPTRAAPADSGGRSASAVSVDSIYGGDGTPWGTDTHLARQDLARQYQAYRDVRLSGRPTSAAVRYDGPAPTAAGGHRRSTSRSASRAHSLGLNPPPVQPHDVREVLGLDDTDREYLTQYPSEAVLQRQQREAERAMAEDTIHRARSTGSASYGGGGSRPPPMVPPSMW